MSAARRPTDNVALSPLSALRCGEPFARVLVVGEDERFRQCASRRLQSGGFNVVATDDGIDALAAAHADPPDLVVVDHVVGWVDVRYLLIRLKDDPLTADIPILLVAPNESATLARFCHALGAALLGKGLKDDAEDA